MIGVIRSKLAPDRLPTGMVTRSGLVARLRSGLGRPLTLVSAPAGYGKTTLLAEWVGTDTETAFAWVAIDGGDCEPARLWTHLIAALASIDPRVGVGSLAEIRAQPDLVTASALPVLLDELSRVSEDLVVILDDYHRAETPANNAAIEMFLRYRPPRVQLVISTRADPGLGIARLRASGGIVEIRADTLRFDDGELSELLEGMGIAGLTPLDEKRLVERTGGWPAPLRLAALLLPDEDRSAFIESFSGGNRQVVDYLTSDVLDMLEPSTREFLLRVSILGRLSGSLCDAVADMSGSGALLADLERSSLFVSVDGAGEWYQQHQLFAEALRLELVRTQPALVPTLHVRAAAWFEAAGDLETATDHAIAGGDVAVAARLVAAQLQVLASHGRGALTRRWLSQLSWPEAQRHPELAFVRAVTASLDNSIELAMDWLDIAATGPRHQVDAAGLPLGFRTDFLRATVGVNDLGRTEQAARRAVAEAPNSAWEAIALSALGQIRYLQGQTAEAADILRVAVGRVPDTHPIMLAFAVGNLGLAESALGSGTHADPLLPSMLSVLRAIGADRTPSGAILQMAICQKEMLRSNPRGALDAIATAIDILSVTPRSSWLVNAYLLRVEVHQALGDGAAALMSLVEAEAILGRLPDPGELPIRAARMRRALSTPSHRVTEFGEELSDREAVVLRLAAAGLSQRDIATQLFISYNTVKSHMRTAYRKLGVNSRDDAVIRLAELEFSGGVLSAREHSPG